MEKEKVFSMAGRLQWYVLLLTMLLAFLPVSALTVVTVLLQTWLYYRFLKKSNTSDSFLKTKGELSFGKKIFAGIAIIGFSYLVLSIVTYVMGVLGIEAIGNVDEEALKIAPWLETFLVVIMVPVSEEIIFRGVILHSLLPYGRWFAIMSSAAFFAVMHGNLVAFLATFVMGFGLNCLALKEGNIYFGMIVHALFNLNSSLGNILENTNYEKILIGFVFVCILVAIIFLRRLPRLLNWVREDRQTSEKVSAFFLRPANLVLTVFLVLSAILEYF